MVQQNRAIEFADIFAELAAPFDPEEVKVRSQGGRQLHYITARTAMNRLDDVLGPAGWWDDYETTENGAICRLTILLPDGRTITKTDAGGCAGMADSGDDEKSGLSDAFKRTCVKFGVGRYLYRDGVPRFVNSILEMDGAPRREPRAEPQQRDHAPAAAAPAASRAERPASPATAPPAASNGNGNGHGVPRTGKALFAWTKDQEQRYEVGLLKYLNSWAKLQEFPGRMVDWDAEQVALAYAEASRKLQSLQSAEAEAYEQAISN